MNHDKYTTDGEPPDDDCWDAKAPKPLREDGMHGAYWVLSPAERAKKFVRPLRKKYLHITCGGLTEMGLMIAETYARNPFYYGSTFCFHCKDHFPVGENGEFVWDGTGPAVITAPIDWSKFEKVGT